MNETLNTISAKIIPLNTFPSRFIKRCNTNPHTSRLAKKERIARFIWRPTSCRILLLKDQNTFIPPTTLVIPPAVVEGTASNTKAKQNMLWQHISSSFCVVWFMTRFGAGCGGSGEEVRGWRNFRHFAACSLSLCFRHKTFSIKRLHSKQKITRLTVNHKVTRREMARATIFAILLYSVFVCVDIHL